MVPRLNCNGLEDVIEGKEGDGEGDDEINTVRGRIIEYLNEKENEDTDEHDSELHILPEYTPIADYIREDSLDGDLGGREVPSTTLNNPTISITSPLCLVGAVDSKEYEHPNIMREEIIEEEILLQKAATRHAAPSSGYPKSSISVSGNDHEHWAIRGNATVAAKALRDVQVLGPLNQKQHDIEYLSRLATKNMRMMTA